MSLTSPALSLRSGHRVLGILENTEAWGVHEGRNGDKVPREREISQHKSGPLLKPTSHSKGYRCAMAVSGHPRPGGGAGWDEVGVEFCSRHSPSLEPRARRTLPSGPV